MTTPYLHEKYATEILAGQHAATIMEIAEKMIHIAESINDPVSDDWYLIRDAAKRIRANEKAAEYAERLIRILEGSDQ